MTEENSLLGGTAAEAAPQEQSQEAHETIPETEAVEPNEPQVDAEEKAQGGIEKRIGKLTARAKAAEEQLEVERQHRALMQQQLQATIAQQQNAPTVDPNAPTEPDPARYANPNDYTKAYAHYIVNSNTYHTQKASKAQYVSELENRYAQKVAEAKDKYDDFDKVVAKADSALAVYNNHPYMSEFLLTIKESSSGADMAYYLGANPQEVTRLLSMSPRAAAVEMGRIENRLNVPPKVKSNAPKPATNTVGKAAASQSQEESFSVFRKRLKSKTR